jgi:hypothetical protein
MLSHVRLAYIDPVSGSILIQTILAAAAGGVTFFRKSIWELFRRRKEDRPAGPAESHADRDPRNG